MPGAATPGGINDVLLGGTSNTAADREAARRITARFPAVAAMAEAGHAFTLAAVRQAAREGITRIIRPGYVTRLPGRNAHEVARAIAPDARTVYVTRGGQATLARDIFGAEQGVAVAQARVAYPDRVLAAPPVAAMLAEGEPACLATGMYYHHADAHWCRAHMAAYAAALPPGSVLACSLMAIPAGGDAAELGALLGTAVYPQARADVAGWAGGMDVIPLTPGITVPGTALGVTGRIR